MRLIGPLRAWIAHQMPADHVPVAAIDRITEHALGGMAAQVMEERLGAQIFVEFIDAVVGHGSDDVVLLRFAQIEEVAAVLLIRIAVEGGDAQR